MKKLIYIGLLLGLSCNASAESFFKNSIFGLSALTQGVDYEVSGNSITTISNSETGAGLELYLDKFYQRSYRLKASFSYVAYDTFDISQLMFSGDYLMPVNSSLTLFAGGALGGAMQKFSDGGIADASLGVVGGVQLGGILFVNNSLMLEMGYRLRPTSIETELLDSSGAVTQLSVVNDLSEAYFSFLLMF